MVFDLDLEKNYNFNPFFEVLINIVKMKYFSQSIIKTDSQRNYFKSLFVYVNKSCTVENV